MEVPLSVIGAEVGRALRALSRPGERKGRGRGSNNKRQSRRGEGGVVASSISLSLARAPVLLFPLSARALAVLPGRATRAIEYRGGAERGARAIRDRERERRGGAGRPRALMRRRPASDAKGGDEALAPPSPQLGGPGGERGHDTHTHTHTRSPSPPPQTTPTTKQNKNT
jgi:hypothetical protein